MKKVLKVIGAIIVLIFLIYFVYRNIALRFVPSSDLVKDESTSRLYKSIMPNTDNPEWTTYYFNNNVSLDDIPLEMKYNIAFNNTGTGMSSVEEEKVKLAYEKTFGNGTYKPVNSFLGGCNTYKYDKTKKEYISYARTTCKPVNVSILSKIIDANETKKSFNLTVKIAYLDKTSRKVYKTCDKNLTNCSGVIKSNFKEFDEANLDNKSYNLHEYKFYYKEDNGNYVFDHNKKIK